MFARAQKVPAQHSKSIYALHAIQFWGERENTLGTQHPQQIMSKESQYNDQILSMLDHFVKHRAGVKERGVKLFRPIRR